MLLYKMLSLIGIKIYNIYVEISLQQPCTVKVQLTQNIYVTEHYHHDHQIKFVSSQENFKRDT